jgi:hypothetical protein
MAPLSEQSTQSFSTLRVLSAEVLTAQDMSIYIHKEGKQLGPFSLEDVNSKVLAGEFVASDPAWIDGWPEWQTLVAVPGFVPRPGPPPFDPSFAPAGATGSPSTSHDTVVESQWKIATDDALPPEGADHSAVFFYIPMSRFIGMSVLTLGGYEFYWIYRNWRYLKERDNLDIKPAWRGFFGMFFIWSLLAKIKSDELANSIALARFSEKKLAIGWIVTAILAGMIKSGTDPKGVILSMILTGASVQCIYVVQCYLNQVNESLSPCPQYSRWSTGHTVLAVLGAFIWLGVMSELTGIGE